MKFCQVLAGLLSVSNANGCLQLFWPYMNYHSVTSCFLDFTSGVGVELNSWIQDVKITLIFFIGELIFNNEVVNRWYMLSPIHQSASFQLMF